MTAPPNTLKTMQNKPDGWGAAVEALRNEHGMLLLDNLQPVEDILKELPKRLYCSLETTVVGSSTIRNLSIYDKNKKRIDFYENLELINDKLYVRIPYVPPRSWFNFSFYRQPSIKLNVRRK